MPRFTLYLVKTGYTVKPRLFLKDNCVQENSDSVFNLPVLIESNYQIETYLAKLKYDPVLVVKATSPENVFIRANDPHSPWWRDFWGISNELPLQSASAIVFKEIDKRLFVFCHGYGRYLLNPFCLEYDFGLRTAANLIDDEKCRTAGLFTPSEVGLKIIKQTGKEAKINEYDINIYNTLLKNISGAVKKEYEDYFKNIEGADSVNFSYGGTIDGLYKTASTIFSISKKKDYLKTGLYWIDNFRPVREISKIKLLDDILLEAINNRDKDILLLYPDFFDTKRDVYFSYSRLPEAIPRTDVMYPFLDIDEQYYKYLADIKYSSIEEVKIQEINAHSRNGWANISNYSVYQCMYHEINDNSVQYYIEGGTWYAIENNFFDEINERYNDLYKNRMEFDFFYDRKEILKKARNGKNNSEYVFNSYLEEHLEQYGISELMDTNTVPYKKNSIEICDVYYKQDNIFFLIHNKYKYGSSALSHLFSQGSVSAECITDKEFRVLANGKINTAELKFPVTEKINRDPFIIVYGMIGRPNRSGLITVPVFSKINLKIFSDNLKRLGFTTKIAFFEDK